MGQSCLNMQEMFFLTWEKFSSNILETFKNVKKSGQLHDVTLVCNDGEINAHKLILFGGSNFFQSVLTKSTHQHPLIYLKGIQMKYLEAIIEFLYNGKVNIAEEDLNNLLETAEDLEIIGLMKRTEQNSKDNFKNSAEDIKDSKDVFIGNTNDEQMGQHNESDVIDWREYVPKIENIPKKVFSKERNEEVKDDSDISLLGILDKFENLETDYALEFMEKVTESPGIRVWKCKVCDKRNSDKTKIRKHVKAQHLKKPAPSRVKTPYYISFEDVHDYVTDEEFQRKVLSLMEKSMGEDQKVTWYCIKCNKSDGDKSRIRKHVEEHINNLLFCCLFCEERRTRSQYMKKHIVLKHSESL